MKQNNSLAWGISLLIFGVAFLVQKLGIIPPQIASLIFDWRHLLLVLGGVFLFTHSNKSNGALLLIIWAIIFLKDFVHWAQQLSDYIWPILLIIAGIFLTVNARPKRRKR